ncbi:MAG: hypothetical protein NTZ50_14630 [Chloroflexi bacterium]|nr:hypothetical protein [Chloroflexota bacterium]
MLNEILLLHHTHTDIGYTHDQPTVWELNRQFIDDALDEIDRTADWDADSRPIWTCEVTSMLEYWKRTTAPRNIERFNAAVAAGRMSACAMAWNFTPMLGVRQFLHSLAPLPTLRKDHGLALNVALNHDVNGLPWTMVPLLLDSGVQMVQMGINVHFGGFPLQRPLFFKWVGPDGRSIIAFNGEHYGMFQRYARSDENSMDAMAAGLQAYEAKLAAQEYPHDFAVLSLTHYSFWDNNPPYPAAYELIRQWNAEGRGPRIRFVTPEQLLARVQALSLPEHRGDWTDYWNFGAASSAHETRLGHEARTALFAADVLSLQRAAPRDTGLPRTTHEAYDALNLWDEHTWGSYASIGDPDRDSVLAGWQHKAYPAYRAHALARYVRTEQLEVLARNPRHARYVNGVLLVNPTPFSRTDYVRLPMDLIDGRYDHLSSTSHRFSEANASENTLHVAAGEATATDAPFGPLTVPAYGYVRMPLAELRLTPATGLTIGADFLESPTHMLRFDAQTGAVRSLFDKRTQHEFADARSPWPLLGLVHEAVDGPATTPNRGREPLLELDYNKFQDTSFKSGWPAIRTVEQTTSIRTMHEPHRIGLEVRADMPGADAVVRRIWLHAHRAEIAVEIALRKRAVDAPDALYLALPLNIAGWNCTYDTMGTPTQLDEEQLTGSCKDWVTVSGYAAAHNASAGVTLACPDAPLVMPGGFVFGDRRLSVDRSGNALLLAWLTNNYWTTNFRAAQPGPLKFRFELATHGAFNATQAARVAAFARGPLLTHPVAHATDVESGTLAQIDDNGIVIAAVLPDGGIFVQNVTDEAREVRITLSQRGETRTVHVPARGLARS